MTIRVCVAGATGWVGRSLVPAIVAAADLALTGAVARRAQGTIGPGGVPISGTLGDALRAGADVLVDFTSPLVAKAHALTAIRAGVHVVIGTSGLTDRDLEEIDRAARERGVGAIAGANFAIAAVLLEHLALIAARHMTSWEVLDYAQADKPDAPSGTARQLAYRLAEVRQPEVARPVDQTLGAPAARGLTLHGVQVHSIRLPGQVIGAEVVFGSMDERLSIRYDGGSSAAPYIAGCLAAIRHVADRVGLRRGLADILSVDTPAAPGPERHTR